MDSAERGVDWLGDKDIGGKTANHEFPDDRTRFVNPVPCGTDKMAAGTRILSRRIERRSNAPAHVDREVVVLGEYGNAHGCGD